MTPTDHVRRMFAAFDSKDVSALAAFMTDDVHLRLGNAEPVQGKSEFDVYYTRLDGGEVTLPCCNVFRLRDGLVAEYRSYIDATPVYS
jgi:ketosteroid isomerase-like protein